MLFSKDVPVRGHYHVIVCGAGPGGVGAAIAAARQGLRVLLIDQAGCIGGYWTSGMLGIALDMPGKGGLPVEIVETLLENHAAQWVDTGSYTYSIEAMKRTLEGKAMAAGVDVLLYTRVTNVLLRGRRIHAILAENTSPAAFTADYFVDGTGHGDLAALAGCAWETGHPQSGARQPASLEALVTGVAENWISDIHNTEHKRELRALLGQAGVTCSYQVPLLFRLTPDGTTWNLAVNHQYDVGVDDPQALSKAAMDARGEITRCVRALRTLPGWERLELVATGEQIGLRDNRRIAGEYRLQTQDALEGHVFDDGIAPVSFCFDVHALSASYQPDVQERKMKSRPFQIPLRSLIARDRENLFLVGRCISGDFYTHSAYRMTTTAAATGEAVGIAASLLQKGNPASSVDGKQVRREMQNRNYTL